MRWLFYFLRPSLNRLRPWRPYLPMVVIALAAAAGGVLLDLLLGSLAPLQWRAERAARHGDAAAAEQLYWRLIEGNGAEVPVVLSFLEVHSVLVDAAAAAESDPMAMQGGPHLRPAVSEEQIDAFLGRSDLPPEVPLVCSYYRLVLQGADATEQRTAVEAAADREPPLPWANHILGQEQLHGGDHSQAAIRFEREGLRDGGPVKDLMLALWLFDADEQEQRLADPRYSKAVTPALRADVAFAHGDWGEWLLWLWPATYLRGDLASWLLAGLAAGLWLWFCWRLGGLGTGTGTQIAAFLLGALSIYPTHVIIVLEQTFLPAMQPRGDLIADAFFYIAGVGLREEAAKLLCFLPLLLLLRRSRQGAGLVLGALVGLGFAAVENISYISGGDLATGLARFLTANFLHMSLTAIAGEAAAAAVRGEHNGLHELGKAFGLVVLLHGVYDLFLACPVLAEISFLAMTTFVFSAQRFLRSAPVGLSRSGMPLYKVVAYALVILAAATFLYGSAVLGPALTAIAIGQGLLGVILITFVFHRELAGR